MTYVVPRAYLVPLCAAAAAAQTVSPAHHARIVVSRTETVITTVTLVNEGRVVSPLHAARQEALACHQARLGRLVTLPRRGKRPQAPPTPPSYRERV